MQIIIEIKSLLQQAVVALPDKMFYKMGIGDYAEHEQFMGVKVPSLRKIAKDFATLSLTAIGVLLRSSINEERLLALFILMLQYKQGSSCEQIKLFNFYIRHLSWINNWNLVDASASAIMGHYLFTRNKNLLLKLAKSTVMWERRIAIVATGYFIKQQRLNETFKIAKILLHDPHDLIHKAVGWMLREAGKQDVKTLHNFLNSYAARMPRIMLRYAIEKFSEIERKAYLARKQCYKLSNS